MSFKPIFEASHLSIARGGSLIYQDISLQLQVGVAVLLGPNGAGKTTLLDALSNPRVLSGGSITANNLSLTDEGFLKTYFGVMGYMPQDWAYFEGFSVQETVEYSAWLKGVPSAVVRESVARVLVELDLEKLKKRRVKTLSGGERQRVGLAEVFVNEPSIVFLDEPTVGLDPEQRSRFRSFIKKRSKSAAILLSSHLTDDAASIADRILVVNRGSLLFDDTAHALSSSSHVRDNATTGLEAGYLALMEAQRHDEKDETRL